MLKHLRSMISGARVPAPVTLPLDLTSAAFIADPAPIYAHLRAHHPIAPVASGGVLLTRHSDIADALSNPALGNAPSRFSMLAAKNKDRLTAAAIAANIPPFQDKPDHIATRQILSRAFHDQMSGAARWVPDIAAQHHSAVAGQQVDLIRDIARPYVCAVMARFVGVANDPAAIKAATGAFFHLFAPIRDRDILHQIEADLGDARRFVAADPAPDGLLATLLTAGMDQEAAVDNALLVLADGIENVEAAIAMSFDILKSRRREWHDADMGAMVAECLRLSSPGQIIPRVVTQPTTLLGQDLKVGLPVFLALGSANLDPEAHTDPDAFRPDRTGETPIMFGRGRHSCIGAPLAELQIASMLSTLLAAGVTRADAAPLQFHPRFGHRWPLLLSVRA